MVHLGRANRLVKGVEMLMLSKYSRHVVGLIWRRSPILYPTKTHSQHIYRNNSLHWVWDGLWCEWATLNGCGCVRWRMSAFAEIQTIVVIVVGSSGCCRCGVSPFKRNPSQRIQFHPCNFDDWLPEYLLVFMTSIQLQSIYNDRK